MMFYVIFMTLIKTELLKAHESTAMMESYSKKTQFFAGSFEVIGSIDRGELTVPTWQGNTPSKASDTIGRPQGFDLASKQPTTEPINRLWGAKDPKMEQMYHS